MTFLFISWENIKLPWTLISMFLALLFTTVGSFLGKTEGLQGKIQSPPSISCSPVSIEKASSRVALPSSHARNYKWSGRVPRSVLGFKSGCSDRSLGHSVALRHKGTFQVGSAWGHTQSWASASFPSIASTAYFQLFVSQLKSICSAYMNVRWDIFRNPSYRSLEKSLWAGSCELKEWQKQLAEPLSCVHCQPQCPQPSQIYEICLLTFTQYLKNLLT